MFFFDLYGKLAFLLALMFCVALILLACVIYYSVANYRKEAAEEGEAEGKGLPWSLRCSLLSPPKNRGNRSRLDPLHRCSYQ